MLPVPIVRRVAVCGATGPRRSAPSGRQRRLGITSTAAGTACRALVLHDREVVVDLIRLTLNHGVFDLRVAANLAEAVAILAEWRPDVSVGDMDQHPQPHPPRPPPPPPGARAARARAPRPPRRVERPAANRHARPGPDPTR